MDGRSSKLADKIHAKYKTRISDLNKQGKSLIGEKFEIDGKTYIIKDEIDYNIEEFKNKLLKIKAK